MRIYKRIYEKIYERKQKKMNYPSNLHITTDLTLQMSVTEPNVIVKAKQGDRLSRYLSLTFMFGEKQFEVSQEISVTLRVTKSDGKVATSTCTVEDGKVIAELTDQMLSRVGRARADVVMTQGKTTISCAPFYIDVHAAGATEDAIESTDDVRTVCERLNDAADEKIAEMQKILAAAGDDLSIKAVSYDLAKQFELSEDLLNGATIHFSQGWTQNGDTYTHKAVADMPIVFVPSIELEPGEFYYLSLTHDIPNDSYHEGDITVALCEGEYLDIYSGSENVAIVLKCSDEASGTSGALKIKVPSTVGCTVSNIELRKVVGSGEKKISVDVRNVLNKGALSSNKSGFWNIALGQSSLDSNINGSRNIALGSYALEDLESGSRNIALGTFALPHAQSADRNVFVGSDSGLNLGKASDCVSIGKAALSNGVKREGDIAIGDSALYGEGEARTSESSNGNIGIGRYAGYKCYGKSNIFIGTNAGYQSTTPSLNVYIGNSAGQQSQSGWGNVAIGASASASGDYSETIAIGLQAQPTKSTQAVLGSDNVITETVLNGDIVIKGNAIKKLPSVKLQYDYTDASGEAQSGSSELLKTEDISKGQNIAIGRSALEAFELSDGDEGSNVAIGSRAGSDMIGKANVLIGCNAGENRTSSSNNVIIGNNAGRQKSADKTVTQGSGLTLIGAGASTADVGYSNSVAIGWNSKVTRSSQVVIGNDQIAQTLLYGDLIIRGTDGTKRKILFNTDGTLGWETVT